MKKILIFGLKDPAGGVEHAVMDYYRHFDHELLSADFVVFGKDFSYAAEIESRGDRVLCLPVRRQEPEAYRKKITEIFTDCRYDAVWCSFSGLTNIDFLKYAKKSGIKKRVAHSHTTALAWGSPLMKYAVKLLHYKNRLVISRYATDYWACTERSGEFMFGKGRTLRIVPNAIDTAAYAYSPEVRERVGKAEGTAGSPLVIGHVGRMCAAKNQCFLLDIFSEILKKEPASKLLFVGDGELRDSVFAHAQRLGITDSVVFTGSRSDTAELYQAMDVFCLPSDNEGFPVTLIEAQTAGLPCAVSLEAVDGTADVCGGMTFISLNESPAQWADRILSLKTDDRSRGAEKVRGAGYDINDAAQAIQSYFLGD